jgi:hypothetical protein
MAARLERTSTPGVYARGSWWVAVYLEDTSTTSGAS